MDYNIRKNSVSPDNAMESDKGSAFGDEFHARIDCVCDLNQKIACTAKHISGIHTSHPIQKFGQNMAPSPKISENSRRSAFESSRARNGIKQLLLEPLVWDWQYTITS